MSHYLVHIVLDLFQKIWKLVVGRWHLLSGTAFLCLNLVQIGSAVGGTASAFYGYNFVMPKVQKWVKGPMWLQFFIGGPPVILFSSACAGLAGGAVPALAQLASSSYHAAMSTSPLTPSQDDKKRQSTSSSTL
ncbi:uncharacterized protein LOC141592973 isoform X2 [Silene latifolia]|uniref:uncharacterized protein LOC141592973 isoform X2 n=1 Tax=Silene latifolia TaxID=37657 RepID=UPI003D787375